MFPRALTIAVTALLDGDALALMGEAPRRQASR